MWKNSEHNAKQRDLISLVIFNPIKWSLFSVVLFRIHFETSEAIQIDFAENKKRQTNWLTVTKLFLFDDKYDYWLY